MRELKYILTFFSLTILFGCGAPPVTFDKPQPENTAELSKFPRRVQGKFQSTEDNSVITINDKTIFRTYDFYIKFAVNQIDSNCTLVGDTIINIRTNEKQLMKREGDTLSEHIYSVDTLFSISDFNILKKLKGYYFLNFIYGKESWEVKKLELHRGQLSICSISTKEDIDLLKEISESTLDSLPYRFMPTKKQFKKFVKTNGFSDVETFVKLK